VAADRLRFREAPREGIRFSGSPGTRSATVSTRTNLADPVDVDVEYRNVQVRYRLSNTLGVEGRQRS
jgi:hypothetical protein